MAGASSGEESDDDEWRSEDSVDTSRFTSFHATNVSFQKRQALGKHAHVHVLWLCVFSVGDTLYCSWSWRFRSDVLGEQPGGDHGVRFRRRPDMAARAVYDRVLAGDVAAREDDRHILILEEMYLLVMIDTIKNLSLCPLL